MCSEPNDREEDSASFGIFCSAFCAIRAVFLGSEFRLGAPMSVKLSDTDKGYGIGDGWETWEDALFGRGGVVDPSISYGPSNGRQLLGCLVIVIRTKKTLKYI